ncbi:MAG: hypothetical protein FJY19_05165 [Bacteroidetes bacterium]|nr:hypothetical protein [Bacteroidota bacterium]
MKLHYQTLLPQQYSKFSRVWIYQSARIFSIQEALEIESRLEQFAVNWKSHGDPVEATGLLLFRRFIIFIADESKVAVGGCSTDASVREIKNIEKEFSVSLFDRTQLSFFIKDKIEILPLAQLNYALEKNFLTKDTLYFNNTVQTLEELKTNWIIPIEKSWLEQKIAKA